MLNRLLVIDGRPICLVTGIPFDGETAKEGLDGFVDLLQDELSGSVELQEVDDSEVHLVLEGNALELQCFDEDWEEDGQDQSDAPVIVPEGWDVIEA